MAGRGKRNKRTISWTLRDSEGMDEDMLVPWGAVVLGEERGGEGKGGLSGGVGFGGLEKTLRVRCSMILGWEGQRSSVTGDGGE